MKPRYMALALTAVLLLLGSNASLAFDHDAAAAQQLASKAKTVPNGGKVKLVDINTAKSRELKTLPGISDAEVSRIIAGRPYSSKADLTVRNILDAGVYENLKKLVIAKQPNKDAAKNAALYKKK